MSEEFVTITKTIAVGRTEIRIPEILMLQDNKAEFVEYMRCQLFKSLMIPGNLLKQSEFLIWVPLRFKKEMRVRVSPKTAQILFFISAFPLPSLQGSQELISEPFIPELDKYLF